MSPLLPPDKVFRADFRKSVVDQLRAIPHAGANAAAELIADLVVHASQEAVATIDRIAAQAPNEGVQFAVLSGAISSTRDALTRVENALQSYSRERGGKIYKGSVEVGADQ